MSNIQLYRRAPPFLCCVAALFFLFQYTCLWLQLFLLFTQILFVLAVLYYAADSMRFSFPAYSRNAIYKWNISKIHCGWWFRFVVSFQKSTMYIYKEHFISYLYFKYLFKDVIYSKCFTNYNHCGSFYV